MTKKWLVLLFVLFISLPSFASEVLQVRADAWMPYNGDPGSEKPGYGIEILKAIFEAKGISIDYQTMPWSRAVADVRTGTFDCVIGAGKRDAEGFVFPAEIIGENSSCLFVKTDSSIKYEDTASLGKIKIGVIADYSYGEKLDQYLKENKGNEQKVVTLTGEDALGRLLKMVLAGRLDGFVENPLVVAQESWKNEVVSAGSVGDNDFLYVAFSPAKESSKKNAEIFDAGIKELRESGRLREILAKYGLEDWKK